MRTFVAVLGLVLSFFVPTFGAISVVQTAAAPDGICGSSSPCTLNLNPTAAGDQIVVMINVAPTSVGILTVTDNAATSSTYVEAGAGGASACTDGTRERGDFWVAANSQAGATQLQVKLDSDANSVIVVAIELSGGDTTSPVDAIAVLNSQASSSTPSGATVNTTQAGDAVVGLVPFGGTITGASAPFTYIGDPVNDYGDGFAYYLAPSAGPYTPQFVTSQAGTSCGSTVAIKPSSTSIVSPICTDLCRPNPQSSTYKAMVMARPMLLNERGMVLRSPVGDGPPDPRPTPPPRHLPSPSNPVTVTKAGSESYSYAVPILHLPGRAGLDLNLTLYYNSRVWTLNPGSNPTMTFNADLDFPSYGFRLDFGYLEWISGTGYVLTEADGTKRLLVVTGANSFDSTDSSYIHYNPATNILTYKNGTQVKYESFPVSVGLQFRPIQITDTNGNYITITYVSGTDQHINTITDTLGRVVTFNYDATQHLQSIVGGGQTYNFSWNTNYIFNYNFTMLAPDSPKSGTTLAVLTGCTYPNGTGYSFSYGDWGIVDGITNLSSSGGTRSSIAYNYPNTSSQLSDAPMYTQETVFDGVNSYTWNYSSVSSGGVVSSLSVTDPSGTLTTTGLNTSGPYAGLTSSVQIVDSSNNHFRTATNTWTSDGGTNNYNPRLSSVATTLDDSGQQSHVDFVSYDSFGNVTDEKEYDYDGTVKRETATTYGLSQANYNHILDRPTNIQIKDSSGTIISQTDLNYDATNPTTPTGAVQHNDTWTQYRGNLTSTIQYQNASAKSGAITHNFTFDATGNLIQADADCCVQKLWTYSSTTNYGYPDSVSTGLTGAQLTTSFHYNLATGTIQNTIDPNNAETQFSYDSMNRVQTITAANGTIFTNAYDDASVTNVAAKSGPSVTTSNSVNSLVSKTIFDGLGHPVLQETLNGASLVSTGANAI